MIKGIGIDIVEIERVQKIVDRGERFAKKVLTPKEFEVYQDLSDHRKVEYLGGRFSIKESFSKAMGTGLGKQVSFQDVETLWDELGKPVTTSKVFDGKIHSSISHDQHEIVTMVVLEGEK